MMMAGHEGSGFDFQNELQSTLKRVRAVCMHVSACVRMCQMEHGTVYDRWREGRDGENFRRNEKGSRRQGELSNSKFFLHGYGGIR
jgi:hypothetical protein